MNALSPESTPQKAPRPFSAFPAVLALFLTFSVAQGIYLFDALQNRQEIQAASTAVKRDLPHAREVMETLDQVGRDLLILSNAKSSEAAKIVAEFNIQLTGVSAPATASR